MSFFHFLKFVMNFLQSVVSICHSFRSTGQPGRINGFDRCFQVVDLYTARRHRVTVLCLRRHILSAPYVETKAFKGIIEPRLEFIETLWWIIEPLLGITKPAEGINKPYLGDFVISSAASEAKASITARTPAKAVDSLYARICLRTINLLNSYYPKIIFSEPSHDIRS